jgi:peptide/nickel transport system substrate-binding protein
MKQRFLTKFWWLPLLLGLAFGPAGVWAAAAPRDTLVVAIDTLGSQSMDPIQETRAAHAHFQAPVFDSLIGIDYEKGGMAPGVAERWEMAKDGLSWTFHLRKDVKFHNGDPLTAHDVKFSLERTMSKESVSTRGASLRRDIRDIEVIDDHTVRVHTKGVMVHLPEGFSRATFQEGQLMPKKYIETVGVDGFRKKPIGSGPWRFVRSVPGDRIEYEAVRGHWSGTPHFNRLVLLLVPEESTRMAMVRTGEAAIASISPESVKEAKSAKLQIIDVPGTAQFVYQVYGLHRPEMQKHPLADPRVRQALSLAIDRKQIIEHVMYGLGRMPMPFAVFDYSLDIDTERWKKWSQHDMRYDPAMAKKLLADAGYANGFELQFANTSMPGTPVMTQIGIVLADFWSRIGIKVRLTNYEWGSFAPIYRGDQTKLWGAVSMYRTAGRPVAPPRYHSGFHSEGQAKLLGTKEHCPDVCKKFDAVHQAASNEKDAAMRRKLTDEMIQLAADAWVGVPVVEGMGTWVAHRDKVGAFKAIPGRHEFGDMYHRIPRPDQGKFK